MYRFITILVKIEETNPFYLHVLWTREKVSLTFPLEKYGFAYEGKKPLVVDIENLLRGVMLLDSNTKQNKIM